MSLRKGHIRSKQWAPPTLRDDWRDDAKCAGMMDDMIPADVCDGCPVTAECGALFDELHAFLQDGTQREQKMIGTYGGIEHPDERKPRELINYGECSEPGCMREQRVNQVCNMHYQREYRRQGRDK